MLRLGKRRATQQKTRGGQPPPEIEMVRQEVGWGRWRRTYILKEENEKQKLGWFIIQVIGHIIGYGMVALIVVAEYLRR